MSVSHLMIPYSHEFETDEFRNWYEKDLPNNLRYGQLPTLAEFEAVLEAYVPEGYKLTHNSSANALTIYIDSKLDNSYLLYVEVSGLNYGEIRYSFGGDRFYLTEVIKRLPYVKYRIIEDIILEISNQRIPLVAS